MVWTQKMSQAQLSLGCGARNFRQPGEGPLWWMARTYLATVRSETLKPNLAGFATIRFCRHGEVSVAMGLRSILTWCGILLRPKRPRGRERQRQ